ncbi:MAG: siderophore-interacting protein [Pseudomonadota bacterium]
MKAHADIEGLAFAAMQGMMLHEAEEHSLPILEQTADRLQVQTEYGTFGISDLGNMALRLHVASDRPGDLHVLRDSLVEHIAHVLPDLAKTITWSDTIGTGQLPPNFQFAQVVASRRLCSDFQRLTLQLSRADGFDDRAIHFRFVLPAPGNTEPEWPQLAANGATRWPKGDKALHRPVYSVRAQREAEIDVDVFQHAGGPAAEWATTVEPGAQVALLGPGGGGILNHTDVVLAGDETAYPAIARILDGLPVSARAYVFLLSHTGNHDYPLPHRDGTNLTMCNSSNFVTKTVGALADLPASFVWVGAESTHAAAFRQSNAVTALPKSNRLIASYWTRGKSAP